MIGLPFYFSKRCLMGWSIVVVLWNVLGSTAVKAQFDFDRPPIDYSNSTSHDAIAKLASGFESESEPWQWDDQKGWLPELLKRLKVPDSSQTLVFSKTSLQIRHISPENPRALYFSDDVYLGWVPGGDLIELSAVDPQIGPVFYSIEQKRSTRPKIERDQQRCMTCHATSKTQGVPGYLVRSVFPGADGHPLYNLGTITTDHTSALEDRFGGWYVTGTHGDIRHRGNVIANPLLERVFDRDQGANLLDVPTRAAIQRYPTNTSDIVALMVLEHQTQVHNFLTRANYETRLALNYQRTMNEALDRSPDEPSDSTNRRIASAAEDLLKCLLLSGEAYLESPIAGNSEFVTEYERLGRIDSQGRSLRQLDLNQRLYRYSCSPLIYSESFTSLPDEVLVVIRKRLNEILSDADQSDEFQHLSASDRAALREILAETLPSLGLAASD